MLFQTILITRVSSQWLKNENPRYVQRLLPELVSSRILKDCWTQSRAFQNDIQASQQLHFSSSALEPFFNAAASQFVLGQNVPLPLWMSLLPVVLGFSIIIFGNTISQQTGIGTTIAIAGVAAYSFLKAREQEKRAHS
ncbi:unnamed protein product [Closterium sp. NIES-64]|nr:unnamed protein product [Closterium sp. NIES-64]